MNCQYQMRAGTFAVVGSWSAGPERADEQWRHLEEGIGLWQLAGSVSGYYWSELA